MPLTFEEMDRVIRKLKMTGRDGKHRFVWFEHEGKKILWTERSQGRGEVGRVEFAIRRQLKVSGKHRAPALYWGHQFKHMMRRSQPSISRLTPAVLTPNRNRRKYKRCQRPLHEGMASPRPTPLPRGCIV
jgi:hypothetical protein